MQIWVDSDACPKIIKEIIFRASIRTKTITTLVANRPMYTPVSPYIRLLTVEMGFDVADGEIVKRLEAGDLVITSDIPLAHEVIQKKGLALSPRGEMYTTENIQARLAIRDYAETLRASGVHTDGPAAFSQSDRQNFSNRLDKFLSTHSK